MNSQGHNSAHNRTHCLLEVGDGVLASSSQQKRWQQRPPGDSSNLVFQNFIFMGDFNAGCSYVPKKAWKNIRLRTDPGFVWLIGDEEDTTVKSSTKCAYDR